MNANTMTLRVYKNEYEPKQIAFIATQFDVVFESESMLTISGTPDDLERVMSAMFCNEEQFKTIFPKFITEAERQAYTTARYNDAKRLIQTTLLEIINHGIVGSEFQKLYSIYQNM